MARKRRETISQQVRAAIEAAPVSRYRIAQETGIDQATLSRFVTGKGGLTNEALDKVGLFLGLRIVTDTQEK